jgi:hypothetical protein
MMATAEMIVNEIERAGGTIRVVGGALRVRFGADPTPELVAAIRTLKLAVIAYLLRPAGATWSAEEWQAFFDERAGIREHDGHHSRTQAEQDALEDCLAQWLALHPPAPGEASAGCFACGKKGAGDPNLVPHLTHGGHFWLHQRCWEAYWANRRSVALADLRSAWPSMPPYPAGGLNDQAA